jgi:hypothetical protein
MGLVVFRTEDATDRPGGLEFLAALLWRGVLYGATDGVLLSVSSAPTTAPRNAFLQASVARRLGAVALNVPDAARRSSRNDRGRPREE